MYKLYLLRGILPDALWRKFRRISCKCCSSMFRVGSIFLLNLLKDLLEEYPLKLKVLVIFMWFVIPFWSIKVSFSASRGVKFP